MVWEERREDVRSTSHAVCAAEVGVTSFPGEGYRESRILRQNPVKTGAGEAEGAVSVVEEPDNGLTSFFVENPTFPPPNVPAGLTRILCSFPSHGSVPAPSPLSCSFSQTSPTLFPTSCSSGASSPLTCKCALYLPF